MSSYLHTPAPKPALSNEASQVQVKVLYSRFLQRVMNRDALNSFAINAGTILFALLFAALLNWLNTGHF